MTDPDRRRTAPSGQDVQDANEAEEGAELAYREKLAATNREAKATFAAASAIFLFFWLAVFLFRESSAVAAGFPLWFWIAVPGGYLLSVAAVLFLVKRVFRNFPLEDEPRR